MSEALKPCPFCGGDDLSEGPHSPYIICNGCGAFGPGDSDVTHEEAIKAWNTRTPDQAIAATLGGGKLTAKQVRDVCPTCGRPWKEQP